MTHTQRTEAQLNKNILPNCSIKIMWDRYGQFENDFVALVTTDHQLAEEFEELDGGDIEALDVGSKVKNSDEAYASGATPVEALEKCMKVFKELL